VSPRVQYGTTCLLIRDAVRSVPYSNEWEIGCSYSPRLTQCKRGRGTATTPGNLSNAMVLHTTLAKLGI
jgi:hypothetical protein